MYNKLNSEDFLFLKSIFNDRLFKGEDINEDFTHDEMPEYGVFKPEAVVEAINEDEIIKLVVYCNKRKIPITPRGAGTGLCGGAVSLYGGIILSLTKMNKILEIDEDNFIAVVEPGALLMDLASAVLEKDLLYPPDPGEKSATIGGNVSTNAGGMRAVKYGITRDYVLALRCVCANGEIMEFGGKVSKTSSGYSIIDLIVGSEGTLCIITKITLKLIPNPKKNISILVPFNTLDECVNLVPIILKSKIVPTALEFFEGQVIKLSEKYLGKLFPDKSSESYLLLTFDANSDQELNNSYQEVADICLNNGARDVLISDTEERQNLVWNARGSFLEAIKNSTDGMDECDVVVPRNKISEFIKFTSFLQNKYKIRIPFFGHAGDGNIHIYTCKDNMNENKWIEVRDNIMKDLYEEASKMGGQVSGEHGIGHGKIKYLKHSIGDKQLTLMQNIKKVFDSNLILNPGKVCFDEDYE